MKITVLSTLFLGCLLVGDSSARAVLGQEGNKNKFVVFAQKEPFVRAGAGHIRKQGLGGKKFSTNEMTSVGSKNGKGADGETSKISGNDSDGLKKSSGLRDQKNDAQKVMIMGPKQYLKNTKFVISRRNRRSRNQKCSQDCNAMPSSSSHEQHISEEPAQKYETKIFADAARKIANMMDKDYHGKPSHRPPINNHEPRN